MENMVIKELERGHEYANELQRLILKPDNGEDDDKALTASYAKDLAVKVEDSLRNAILLLNSDRSHQICENRSQTIKGPRRFSPCKRKIQKWEEYSKIPKEDGYAWRKYGEKIILNAKYPRRYYRCSYKNEQGCEAIKQVQIIQDNPPLYRITYFGYHTCTKPQIFLNSNEVSRSTSRFINFDNNHNNNTTFLTQPNHPLLLSSFPRLVRNLEEYCKNSMQLEDINGYVPSINDCLLSPDGEIPPFEPDDLLWM